MTTLLHEFVQWVNAQPKRKRYAFESTRTCALAQFGKAYFVKSYVLGGVYSLTVGDHANNSETFWLFENKPAHNGVLSAWADAIMYSTTFGQLTTRLTPIMEKINANV